jgi:hypothetical protein
MLIREEISDNEWNVIAKVDIPDEKNFTLPIMQHYLNRKQREMLAEKNPDEEKTNFLRRTIDVNEIERMILRE